jgi:hypothetical protein
MKYGRGLIASFRVLTISVIMLNFTLFFTGFVFSAEPSIDLYNQKGGQGLNQPSDTFSPGEQVILYACVYYNMSPVEGKLVAFEVKDPCNNSFLDRTGQTDESGIAAIDFTLPITCIPGQKIIGVWTAISVVSVAEMTINDTLTFKVTGAMIDLYTQKDPYSGRGPNMPSDAFAPQEEVILYAYVSYDCNPLEGKLVAFEVKDANGTSITYKTDVTNVSGLATTSFRISNMPFFGTWSATATVEVLQRTINDSLTFNVGWIVQLDDVKTINEHGDIKSSFLRGEYMCFNLTVHNIAFLSKIVTFTIVAYDEQGVSVGVALLCDWPIPPGTLQVLIVNLQLPRWAFIGVGSVYANVYTNLPFNGGVPYSPEISTVFLITQ